MTRMNDSIRDEIWERDNGVCQSCGKNLMDVIDPLEIIKETLSSIPIINVYRWSIICWKCRAETPVVTYNFNDGNYDYSIGSVEKLDRILMKRYPFVNRKYSRTREETVTANTCRNCDALQGNFYIGHDLFEMECEGDVLDERIDMTIPNDLKTEDLYRAASDEEFSPYEIKHTEDGKIHHIDQDRHNNDPENLVLLCMKCHRKVHRSKDSRLLKPRIRANSVNPNQTYKYVKCSECGGRARVKVAETTGMCRKCRDYKDRLRAIEEEKKEIKSVLDWNRKYR